MTLPNHSQSFLLIRRDNIGDLVCTTPLFRALRERFPSARICALVNSYNAAVLRGNPDVDEVFAYTKAKHRPMGQSVPGVYLERMRMLARLRAMHFDYAILAAPGFQERSLLLARMIRPRHILGFTEKTKRASRHVDIGVSFEFLPHLHEVEDVFRLLQPLGISGLPSAAAVYADKAEAGRGRSRMVQAGEGGKLTIGIHISARKPSQRWPVERFSALIRALHEQYAARFLLFWSPGDENNPLHPGDDGKAEELMHSLGDMPVLAYPTQRLEALIAGLSLCDALVCSDGGAMHLAAGLGKPILCFFGQSDAARWHPWGVPYVLLQPESRDVKDISAAEALAGFSELMERSPDILRTQVAV
ncbi:MAG: glycosyltransferase family 9 protein [Sulfurimicrobium sp.]|nr:glycosyltransferase family 9 protein [Sulfurimicrobium sp.]